VFNYNKTPYIAAIGGGVLLLREGREGAEERKGKRNRMEG